MSEILAHERARALLLSWLSAEQRRQFEATSSFVVVGSTTGRRYCITYGRQLNVFALDDSGRAVQALCFVPEDMPATADCMLAQKIALETDETAALAIAERAPDDYWVRFWQAYNTYAGNRERRSSIVSAAGTSPASDRPGPPGRAFRRAPGQ